MEVAKKPKQTGNPRKLKNLKINKYSIYMQQKELYLEVETGNGFIDVSIFRVHVLSHQRPILLITTNLG